MAPSGAGPSSYAQAMDKTAGGYLVPQDFGNLVSDDSGSYIATTGLILHAMLNGPQRQHDGPPYTHTMPAREPVEGEISGSAVEHAILNATARTLRVVAGWTSSEEWRRDLIEVAEQVERYQPGHPLVSACCPVCEETWCDGDCPLKPIRDEELRRAEA